MLEESGRVVRLGQGEVWVETVRQSSCSSCSARKGCGQRLLAEIGQGERFQVLAENPRNLPLQAGDEVVLGLEESALLRASATVYLLPLVAMIALALVTQQLGLAEPLVALAGMAGLALGFVLARRMGGTGQPGCRYHPKILRVAG